MNEPRNTPGLYMCLYSYLPFILCSQVTICLELVFRGLYNSALAEEMGSYYRGYSNAFVDGLTTHTNPLSKARRIF